VVPSSVPGQPQSNPTTPVHNPTLPLQANRVLGLKTPAVVPQGRYRVADLEESEQECAPIAFSYQVDPCDDSNSEDSSDDGTFQPGKTVKVEFSIKNRGDGDRPGAVFTNYFPVNATFVPNSLHLEQESDEDDQSPVTVDVQGDRFIVTAPDLPADQEISGTFQLQIAPTAKNGDPLKNVFTYKDQTTPAPVAKKAEDTIGAKPCHCMGNATLPSLQVDHLVGLTVVKPGAASDSAEVGDDLTHTVTVTNLGDVPADDTQVDLVVPDVAEFSTGSIQVLPDYVDVNAGPIVPGNSLTVKLGNLRGGDHCVWHTRVRRGAPDQARIGGAVQVRCAPWGINGGYEMRAGGGGYLVVAAPVLSGSFELLPVGSGGGGFVAGGGLTFRGHVVNTGHGRATGFYMVPKFPRGGFRTRRVSGPIGAGNSVILEIGGGGIWGECDHDIPADMAGQPLNVLGSWVSDQTLPFDPVPATSTMSLVVQAPPTASSATGTVLQAISTKTAPLHQTFDTSGNLWFTSFTGNSVTELSPAGVTLRTLSTGANPWGIACDPTGNLWVTNYSSNSVSKLSQAGVILGTFGVSSPQGIAVDTNGNAWAASWFTSSVTKLAPNGSIVGVYPVGPQPQSIAIDSLGYVWVSNYGGNSVTKLASTGRLIGNYAVGTNPEGLTVDSANNIWVTNFNSHNVTKLAQDGTTLGTYPVGLNPVWATPDGSGNVWVVDYGSGTVNKLSASGTILGSYKVGLLPTGISINSSGEIWVANSGSASLMKLAP